MTAQSNTREPSPSRDRTLPRDHTSAAARPWWLEQLLVDLRHAFWPWFIYAILVGICFYYDEFVYRGGTPPVLFFLSFIGALFTWSAAAAVIFTADYSHGTITSLLTSPRERSKIWLLRSGMTVILLVLPLLISPFVTTLLMQGTYETGAIIKRNMQLFHFGFVQLATCMVISVTLRKALLVWPVAVLSPLLLMIPYLLVRDWLNFTWGQYSTPEKFPFQPPAFFWFSMAYGTITFLAAWRLWLRLEVR